MNKIKSAFVVFAIVAGTIFAPVAADAVTPFPETRCSFSLASFSVYWGWWLSGWFIPSNTGTACLG